MCIMCICLHIAYIHVAKEVASLWGVARLMGWHVHFVNERMCELQYRAVGNYQHVELYLITAIVHVYS